MRRPVSSRAGRGARPPGRLVALLLGACLALAACDRAGEPSRVLILGLDGLDPATVDTLMAEGKLPNFGVLRQDGAYGRLESQKPLLSPIIWTTIATGHPPDVHGIGHFVAVNPKTGQQLPVTSQMRRTRALWNVFSDQGRSVEVVGWWATWPAEPVHGTIVSDHTAYHFLFEDGFDGGAQAASEDTGKTYPPGLEAEIEPKVRRPSSVTREEVADFVDVSPEVFAKPFDFQDDLGHFRWAYATANTYRDVGLDLWRSRKPDLGMVYIEGTDSTAHLFGHLFRAEGLAGELAEQQRRYGGTVEAMYLFADRILGEFMAAMDDRTTLVVLSDHGFELGALPDDPSKTRSLRRVSERYHRLHGILYLYGHGVKRHARIDGATILDVAPTVLALAGIPPAADMPGRVLREALRDARPRTRVATYEPAAGTPPGSPGPGAPAADSATEAAMLAHLEALGYLDTTSPQGDRNLAGALFESGRYEEALAHYRALAAADPGDASLQTSLAGTLGALGRYEEARTALLAAIELQPLNPEAHHNLAVLYERSGDPAAALEHYRTAVRYAPQYEPSRQALLRLTGRPDVRAPEGEAEQEAFLLAEAAARTARRGAYAEAMALLDEAAAVAPDYVLVHQYRSNVAYLMGDTPAAIAALERALELEPGNALFEANLQRIREDLGVGEAGDDDADHAG